MTKEEAINELHLKFRDKYRALDSAHWQTYLLGVQAGWFAAAESPEAELAYQNSLQDKFGEGYSKRMDDEKLASLQQGWTDEDMRYCWNKAIESVHGTNLPEFGTFAEFIQSLPPKSREREGLFAEFLIDNDYYHTDDRQWTNSEGKYFTTTELLNSPEFHEHKLNHK